MTGVDSGAKFEALEVGGYMLSIYMYNMSEREKELIHHPKMQFGVIQDTPSLILATARFGSSPLIFEMAFDPTLYEDDRAFQLILTNNIMSIVGVDSRTNIVKALRAGSIPVKLRERWMNAWTKAREEENFSEKYTRWVQDLTTRYTVEQIWNMSDKVGRLGDKIGD